MTYLGARICDKHHAYLADKPEETILNMVVDKSIVQIRTELKSAKEPVKREPKMPKPGDGPVFRNKAFESAWNKGKKAKLDGTPVLANPYSEETIMSRNFRRFWKEGWESGDKA